MNRDPSLLKTLCLKDACLEGFEHSVYVDCCKFYGETPVAEHSCPNDSIIHYLMYTIQSIQTMKIFNSPSNFPSLPQFVSDALPSKPRPRSAPTKISALAHLEQELKRLQQLLMQTLTLSEDASASEMWSRNVRDELIFKIQALEDDFDEAELMQLMLKRNYEDKLFQIGRAKEKHEDFKREVQGVQSHFSGVLSNMNIDGGKIEKEMRSWRRKISVVEDDLSNRLRRSRMLEADLLHKELKIGEKKMKRQSVVLCQEELTRELAKLREMGSNKNPRLKKLQTTLLNTNRRLSEINLQAHHRKNSIAENRYRGSVSSKMSYPPPDRLRGDKMSHYSMKAWDTLTLPETLDTVSALTTVDNSQFHIPIDLLKRQHRDLLHENSRLERTLKALNSQIAEVAKSQELYISDQNLLQMEKLTSRKFSFNDLDTANMV